MNEQRPTCLAILDGFGYSVNTNDNPIAVANMPNFRAMLARYPNTLLAASGESVGLPLGTIGGSEVGHTTIGAGRVIEQSLLRINNAIASGEFFEYARIRAYFSSLLHSNKTLHLIGLLSNGGVHSHEEHFYALLKIAEQVGLTHVIIHPILDGRDTTPGTAPLFLEKLSNYLANKPGWCIGSIHGRFYAMDRGYNWDRTDLSMRALQDLQVQHSATWQQVLTDFYHAGISDEFILPTQLTSAASIKPGDGVFFVNFRAERMQQLLSLLAERCSCSWIVTMEDIIPQEPLHETLKEVLDATGKSIFAIAETEKFPHITYFLGGWHATPYSHEEQIAVQSISCTSYAQYPAMSAAAITDRVIASCATEPRDIYLINYANADMVGHSGDFDATVLAVEALDIELGRLHDLFVKKLQGTLYITGDHGNAEHKIRTAIPGNLCTTHTLNPVYLCMARTGAVAFPPSLRLQTLADIAPLILTGMGLQLPPLMQRA